MELRVLRYFQMVAREENITRAAQLLHVTQPTLSRQLMQLEDELGTKLFKRKNHSIFLTEDGMRLKKRCKDILELADQIDREFAGKQDGGISGKITIGSAETKSIVDIAKVMEKFQEDNPLVQYEIYTANADDVKEKIENGTVDVGVLSEPVDISKFNFIRMNKKERWGILTRNDSDLAGKEYIESKDLTGIPLIMVKRELVKNELGGWFGEYFDGLDIAAEYNLLNNAAILAQNNIGSVLCFDVGTDYDNLKFIPLNPEVKTGFVLVWRKNQTLPEAVSEFIKKMKIYIKGIAQDK